MTFSTANLAVVAYAHVNPDGTSPDINSGVTTTRISGAEGLYLFNVILPGNENVSQTTTLQQGQGPNPNRRKDLILVTPTDPSNVAGVNTLDMDEFTKQIGILGTATTGFDVVILRPTIPSPTDSNGVENGPT